MVLARLSLFAVLAPLVACASQVDADHQGDPLAKVSGSVRNTRTLPISGSEVVTVWHKSSGSPDLTVSDSVEVEGSFPAQFTLSIYEPPSATLLNDWGGVTVGVALFVAGVPGTDYSDDSSVETGLLGLDENHLLVYLPQQVPAGSNASYILRGTPAAGFHVYNVHKLTETDRGTRRVCIDQLPDPTIAAMYTNCGGSASFDDFIPVSTDLSTPLSIDLVDDLSQVEIPDWT